MPAVAQPRDEPAAGERDAPESIASSALLARVLERANLQRALKQVRSNRGAPGIDGMTVDELPQYLRHRWPEIRAQLLAGNYRPQPVLRVEIPKPDGGTRPLGITTVLDRFIQQAIAQVVQEQWEPHFHPRSYGFRPGRSAHQAVRQLQADIREGRRWVVDLDLEAFFDHLEHDRLLAMLSVRIDDRAFLGLIRKWLKAGILEPEGRILHPDAGTPQGGIVSPVLANVYLHYVLDLWFEKVVKPRCQGEALLCRYADDWVGAFRYREDAQAFYRVLPKRLGKFNLEVAPEKTRLLRFSRFHPSMRRRTTFLGFEFFWQADRKGTPRVTRRTARKKLQAACRRIKEWIKLHRHLRVRDFFSRLNSRLRGHYNYYGVRGNSGSLSRFFAWAVGCAFKWLNRRGGKRSSFSYTWGRFAQVLDLIPIARPRITEIGWQKGLA